MFAILAAAYTWGNRWAGQRIIFITDNEPITRIWDKGSTPAPSIMTLVRKLFLIAVQNQFSVAFKHISGKLNPIADALSRFQVRRFKALKPGAAAFPNKIPDEIWTLLKSPTDH